PPPPPTPPPPPPPHPAVPSEKNRGRKRGEAIELRQRGGGRLGVGVAGQQQRERDSELLPVAPDLAAVHARVAGDLEGQAHDLETPRVILPPQRDQRWCGVVAGGAPASEDIHQQDLVPESRVDVRHNPAIEIGERE